MTTLRAENSNVGYTNIGPGLAIKVPFTGTIDLDAGDAFGSEVAQVVMDIDLVNGILQPVSVKVVGRDGHPVTGTTLRQVPVKGMAANLIQSVIAAREDTATGTRVSVGLHSPIHLDDAQKARLRDQGPVEESLRAVANFYEFGRVTGYPPAKFVEDNLGLPRTTASKWVRRAREAGFLSDSTPLERIAAQPPMYSAAPLAGAHTDDDPSQFEQNLLAYMAESRRKREEGERDDSET
ncbi:hypothetical protein [Mycobacteroides salmoniphilum]|uniref:hypothetical protein n=1 Tax=Mycobacteroides salmoniphilum TaxID=404941 RepID=UPI00106515C8|nr:hypothetical protein [Mycobacteroides salmoniphilum]